MDLGHRPKKYVLQLASHQLHPAHGLGFRGLGVWVLGLGFRGSAYGLYPPLKNLLLTC